MTTTQLMRKQLEIMKVAGFVHCEPHMDALLFSRYTEDLLKRLEDLAGYARSCEVAGIMPTCKRIDRIAEGKS